jgi:hypothetical protein
VIEVHKVNIEEGKKKKKTVDTKQEIDMLSVRVLRRREGGRRLLDDVVVVLDQRKMKPKNKDVGRKEEHT